MHYSGTVAAAREGNICGIPAVALSMEFLGAIDLYFDDCATMAIEFIDEIFERIEQEEKHFVNFVFNVNFPNVPHTENCGWKLVNQGHGIVRDELTEESYDTENGLARFVFSVRSKYDVNSNDINIDSFAVQNRFTAVTIIPLFGGYALPNDEISKWSIFKNNTKEEKF